MTAIPLVAASAIYIKSSPYTEQELSLTFLLGNESSGVISSGSVSIPDGSSGLFGAFVRGYFEFGISFLDPPQPGLYRVSNNDYPPLSTPVLTQIPGSGVFGGVLVCLAIGENDYLIGGSKAVGRIKDDVVVWSRTTLFSDGIINAVAYNGTSVLFVWQRILGSFPGPYTASLRYITASVDLVGTGSFDVGAAQSMTTAAAESTDIADAAAVVAAQMSNFIVGMNNSGANTPDGAYGGGQRPLVGPAIFSGSTYEITGYDLEHDDLSGLRYLGLVNYTGSISGDTYTTSRVFSPVTAVEGLSAFMPAESSPGVEIDYIYWPVFGFSYGPPPPVPPFWTSLRRAIEEI